MAAHARRGSFSRAACCFFDPFASLELGRSDDRFEVLLRTRGSHIIIITAAVCVCFKYVRGIIISALKGCGVVFG